MPDVATTKDTVQSVLQDIRARLTILESFPSGMQLLSSVSGDGFSGGGYYSDGSGGFEYLSGAHVPQATFTVIRPTPILVLAEIGGFYGSGGTANYVVVRAAIMAHSTDLHGANDANGLAMESGRSYQTVNSGIANAAGNLCRIVSAGTYFVGWGYSMQGGATTTFNCLQNSVYVFAVSG